ncbi:MAG TPA: hypothetical protein VFV78_04280 [Vicinamibacterales bacterium]|nr:hypothetical protein [Vicinamibacterales bacterium]
MRKLVSVVVGLMVAGAMVAAQTKAPAIKKVKEQVSFSDDVKVGSTILKAGRYEVSSSADGAQLTFRKLISDISIKNQFNYDMKEKPVVANVKATPLPEKAKGTRMDLPDDPSGVKVLKSLTLDGTNITFSID